MECLIAMIVVVVVYLLATTIEAGILYLLWNLLVVDAFNVNPITFWQSFIVILVISFIASFFKSVNKKDK